MAVLVVADGEPARPQSTQTFGTYDAAVFAGFPRDAAAFLAGLKENNNRTWFEEHRGTYEAALLQPARAFVVAMCEQLRAIAPDVHADPRVNGSIFRINRDTAFHATSGRTEVTLT